MIYISTKHVALEVLHSMSNKCLNSLPCVILEEGLRIMQVWSNQKEVIHQSY